jgi:hypothetical protein
MRLFTLSSDDNVDLDGATLLALVGPGTKGEEELKTCPIPARGTVYKFITAEGTISGEFSNAPEGGEEIPIHSQGAVPRRQR